MFSKLENTTDSQIFLVVQESKRIFLFRQIKFYLGTQTLVQVLFLLAASERPHLFPIYVCMADTISESFSERTALAGGGLYKHTAMTMKMIVMILQIALMPISR